jgi:hypothetical protein
MVRWVRKPAPTTSRRVLVPTGEDRHTYWRRLDRDEIADGWIRRDRGDDRRPWLAPREAVRRWDARHDL